MLILLLFNAQMGNFWYGDDEKMCFNAAKSWQLGWYIARHLTVTKTNPRYEGYLASVIQDPSVSGPPIIIKVPGSSHSPDFYLTFNAASGITAGSGEAKNQVTVTKQTGEGVSHLVATLGEPFKIVDEHLRCPYWAATGECDVNPNYMLVNCILSCNKIIEKVYMESYEIIDVPPFGCLVTIISMQNETAKVIVELLGVTDINSTSSALPNGDHSSFLSVLPSARPSHISSSSPSFGSSTFTSSDLSLEAIRGPSCIPSIVPTGSPKEDLISEPSSFPSEILCMDSPLRFTTFNDGIRYSKFCSNVKKQNTAVICEFEGVSTHCPVTCGSCSTMSCRDSLLLFRHEQNNRYIFIGCERIKYGDTENQCSNSGIFHTCRATCGSCLSLAPSKIPSFGPSAL